MLLIAIVCFSACKSNPDLYVPGRISYQINYTDLNQSVSDNNSIHLDIDGDDNADIIVESNKEHNERSLRLLLSQGISIMTSTADQPSLLSLNDRIAYVKSGYAWKTSEASFSIAQLPANGHQYLAVSIARYGMIHYGWLEISADKTSEAVMFYKMAINQVPEQATVVF